MIDAQQVAVELETRDRDLILLELRRRGWLHFSGSITTQIMHLDYWSMLEFRFPRGANMTVLFFKEFRGKDSTWVLEEPTLAELLAKLEEAAP